MLRPDLDTDCPDLGAGPLPWERHPPSLTIVLECRPPASLIVLILVTLHSRYLVNTKLTYSKKIYFSIINQFYVLFAFLSMSLSSRAFGKWLFLCISELSTKDTIIFSVFSIYPIYPVAGTFTSSKSPAASSPHPPPRFRSSSEEIVSDPSCHSPLLTVHPTFPLSWEPNGFHFFVIRTQRPTFCLDIFSPEHPGPFHAQLTLLQQAVPRSTPCTDEQYQCF